MDVFFLWYPWYPAYSDLPVYANANAMLVLHWTSHFFQGTKKTRPSGHLEDKHEGYALCKDKHERLCPNKHDGGINIKTSPQNCSHLNASHCILMYCMGRTLTKSRFRRRSPPPSCLLLQETEIGEKCKVQRVNPIWAGIWRHDSPSDYT